MEAFVLGFLGILLFIVLALFFQGVGTIYGLADYLYTNGTQIFIKLLIFHVIIGIIISVYIMLKADDKKKNPATMLFKISIGGLINAVFITICMSPFYMFMVSILQYLIRQAQQDEIWRNEKGGFEYLYTAIFERGASLLEIILRFIIFVLIWGAVFLASIGLGALLSNLAVYIKGRIKKTGFVEDSSLIITPLISLGVLSLVFSIVFYMWFIDGPKTKEEIYTTITNMNESSIEEYEQASYE